tara:strand:+ start:376 stop:588 length:213 start_codon:yes stop_codon:yes gene_type:complete
MFTCPLPSCCTPELCGDCVDGPYSSFLAFVFLFIVVIAVGVRLLYAFINYKNVRERQEGKEMTMRVRKGP